MGHDCCSLMWSFKRYPSYEIGLMWSFKRYPSVVFRREKCRLANNGDMCFIGSWCTLNTVLTKRQKYFEVFVDNGLQNMVHVHNISVACVKHNIVHYVSN